MDPGTALGAVSLILDLTKDLYEYYRAWKDCNHDAVELRQRLLATHNMFRVLRETLRQPDLESDKKQLVYDSIERCNNVANELRDKLKIFPSEKPPSGKREKMLALGLRILYPCRKSTIMALEEDLEPCTRELQGAVGVVVLASTLDMSQRLKQVDKRLEDGSERFEAVMDGQFKKLEGMSSFIDETRNVVVGIQDKLGLEEQRRAMVDIMEWLCPTDYSQQQNDFFANRSGDTGDWIFTSSQFAEWVQNSPSILVCPGDPGAGKTIMAATVIRHLLEEHEVTAIPTIYVYFNYKSEDQQDVMHVLGALVRQLVYAKGEVPDTLAKLYNHYSKRQTRPTQREIENELISIISSFKKVNVVIDALDECREHIRKDMITAIKNIHKPNIAHVLVTSRPFPHILSQFEDSIHLEIRASDTDLSAYLRMQLSHASKAVQVFTDDIVTTIIKKVKGIFLLAKLFVEYVREAKKRKLVNSILAKIETQCDLDMSLYDYAYESAMERILAQTRETRVLALEALAWITHAQRPLKSFELEHALAIETDLDVHEFDEENIVPREEIVNCCAGLITEDSESGTIRLVHYTTQKYLERKLTTLPDAPAPNPEYAISIKCLRYLSFDVLASGPCTNSSLFQRLKCHPFLRYAARYWGVHIRRSEDHDQTPENDRRMIEVAGLFLNRPELVKSAVEIAQTRRSWKNSYQGESVPHLLAEFGITRLFLSLKPKGLNMDLYAYNFDDLVDDRTPLMIAAANGHTQLVEMLLSKKANVNSCDRSGLTPLMLAVRRRRFAVIKLLLANDDIDVNLVNEDDYTALSFAAKGGYVAIVELLLAKEAIDLNPRNAFGETPLFLAARRGRTEVVQLLLAKEGVNVNLWNDEGISPLMQAALEGHANLIDLFLNFEGTNVDEFHKIGPEMRREVIKRGHVSTLQSLLTRRIIDGISCDMKEGENMLSDATHSGCVEVIDFLIAKGAIDLGSRDHLGWTLLHWVVLRNHIGAAEFLLAKPDIEVDARNKGDETPLMLAASKGFSEVAKLLVERGADVNARAVMARSPMTVKSPKAPALRTDDSADLRESRGGLCNALYIASFHGSTDIVATLVEGGANVNAQQGDLGNALNCASFQGHVDVAALLIKHGADVNARGSPFGGPDDSALKTALMEGHEELATLLRDHGAVQFGEAVPPAKTAPATASHDSELVSLWMRVQAFAAAKDARRDVCV